MESLNQKNQFEPLRRPGTVGEVVSRDFRSLLVYQKADPRDMKAVTVYTGQLLPGVWGFGYHLVNGKINIRVLPGELDGWFRSEEEASMYALEHLRISDKCPDEAKEDISKLIYQFSNPSLF